MSIIRWKRQRKENQKEENRKGEILFFSKDRSALMKQSKARNPSLNKFLFLKPNLHSLIWNSFYFDYVKWIFHIKCLKTFHSIRFLNTSTIHMFLWDPFSCFILLDVNLITRWRCRKCDTNKPFYPYHMHLYFTTHSEKLLFERRTNCMEWETCEACRGEWMLSVS